jgi:hypothetical protein
MNKKLLLVFIALLIIGFTVKIDTQASIGNGETVTITKDSEDITGDGKVDQIVLKLRQTYNRASKTIY